MEVVGQTEGAREVEVRALVGGVLRQWLHKEGEKVQAGQALFKIDPAPYQIAEAKARADLLQAHAKVEQAVRLAARLKSLLPHKAVSQNLYDDTLAQAEAAAALEGVAAATLEDARLRLSWTTVAAPVTGLTGRALHSEGTLVTLPGDNLLTTMVQNDPLWVRFALSEYEVAKLPAGRLTPETIQGVEMVFPDHTVYPATGRINFAAHAYDPHLGTLSLRAEFPNPKGQVMAGQFVRVRLLLGTREGVFLVPQIAVLQSEQGRTVMVLDPEDKVVSRPVRAGEWRGSDWAILDGLKAGDRILTDNLQKARPGTVILPLAPGETPSGKTGPAKP
jgi:membrane fusion protein (multidrug efflux system)